MTNDEKNYEEIRLRVDQRYEDLGKLIGGIIAYFMVAAAVLTFVDSLQIDFLFKIVTALILLAGGDGAKTKLPILSSFLLARNRERAIEREIELALYHRDGTIPSFIREKRKGVPQRLVIQSDGEIGLEEDTTAHAIHYGR